MFPPKQPFFSWEATWGKLLNLENLQKKGAAPPQSLLSLWAGIRTSYIATLSSGQPSLGSFPLLSRSLLGLPENGQGGSSQLEVFFCWKKKKKHVEIGSTLHLLDCVEGT